MDPIAERVARNDAAFRDANERIEAAAEDADLDTAPFICECADERCTELVSISLAEYEQVRRDSTLFLNVPGHEASARGWVRVVESLPNFVVVEKLGDAAVVVEQLDSREPDSGDRRFAEEERGRQVGLNGGSAEQTFGTRPSNRSSGPRGR